MRNKKRTIQAEKTAQSLRASAVLVEGLSLGLSSHIRWLTLPVTPVPGIQYHLMASTGTGPHVFTIHTQTHMHIY